ncbi:MAG: L,D-transpeptidase family protein [Flavobacteriaceae bacterium]|nr:L,D-transpeptidase family protein [Flavobacteriaceae bacterium]
MKSIYFFILFIFLISCRKENPPQIIQIPKIEITPKGKILLIDSLQLSTIKDSIILDFYKTNNNRTYWLNQNSREKVIKLLNNVNQEGLFLQDFDIKKINNTEKNVHQLTDEELINYDILLTQNLNQFIKKVAIGSINPKKLYKDWDLKENNINLKELLLNFQRKDSLEFALNAVRPHHIVYKRIQEALHIIQSMPKEDFKKIEIDHKIALNDTNAQIITIKGKLIYWKDLKPQDTLTNLYDDTTLLAVQKFQMRHGLAPDGVIGIGTIAALNFSKAKREAQIIANLERWRWYPRNFEQEYLIINIPDYILHVIKNNDTTRTHKIIVGRADRKTPILSSKLSHLIFNPTWTVPPTILRKDVIPATKRDINYLFHKNIKIYDSQGNVVSYENWQFNKARSYTYVQTSGKHNSLGLMKFIFPNRFLIYLHDTNSRGYFEKEIRALSSGCIRVQNPFELAAYLLDDPEQWSLEKIDEAINYGKTKDLKFSKEIYIHIFYWTAWIENGVLCFRDDLYNLDIELYQKLKK